MKLSDLSGGDAGAKPLTLSQLVDAPAPPAPPPPAPAPQPSPLAQVGEAFADIPREIGHEIMEAGRANEAELKRPQDASDVGALISPRTARIVGNASSQLAAPITGAVTSAVGRPVEKLTGIPRETTGNIVSIALPFVGEAMEARSAVALAKQLGVSETAARAMMKAPKAPEPLNEHQGRVARLQARGVEMTPGQMVGGMAKRREDVHTTSPYVGQALRDARQRSIDSFQRATYDHVLEALGKNSRYTGPVGHEGMQNLYNEVDAAYGRALLDPKVRAVKDGNWDADVKLLRQKYPKSMRDNFDHQVAKLWIDQPGAMDGPTFKAREGDFRKLARDYETSGVASERELGRYLSEAGRYFRDTVERSSPPGTRAALRRADDAYALLRRVEGAASRRTTLAGGRGVSAARFAPGDLLQAIKQQDDSLHHRAFTKGDARLQRFAEDAQGVLPSDVADSGSAERIKTGFAGRVAGLLGGGLLGHQLGLGNLGAEAGGALGVMAGEPIDRVISGATNSRKAKQLAEAAQTAVGPKHSVLRQVLRDRRLAGPVVAAGAAENESR